MVIEVRMERHKKNRVRDRLLRTWQLTEQEDTGPSVVKNIGLYRREDPEVQIQICGLYT